MEVLYRSVPFSFGPVPYRLMLLERPISPELQPEHGLGTGWNFTKRNRTSCHITVSMLLVRNPDKSPKDSFPTTTYRSLHFKVSFYILYNLFKPLEILSCPDSMEEIDGSLAIFLFPRTSTNSLIPYVRAGTWKTNNSEPITNLNPSRGRRVPKQNHVGIQLHKTTTAVHSRKCFPL